MMSRQDKCGVVIFCSVLLFACCRGQLSAPSQVVTATAGETAVLPCYLESAADESSVVVEWARDDINLGLILVRTGSKELHDSERPSYQGRMSLPNNKLTDVSLKISDVRVSDGGTYQCLVQSRYQRSFIKLIVGVVSEPVIEVVSDDSDELVLGCESGGWYPEPEVLWLDSEGKLLPAGPGPAETVRGADDLYTVSSRVTVEKRRRSLYTCRVRQRDTNHSRDAHIYITSMYHYKLLEVSCLTVACCFCAFIVFWWKTKPSQSHAR